MVDGHGERGLAVEAVVCLFFISVSTSMVQGSYHGSSTSPHFTVHRLRVIGEHSAQI